MLVSTALVLFMMIPGLAMFYAGLVRSKNVLSLFMQCYALTAVMSLVWFAVGYSLSFSGSSGIVGNLDLAFLSGIGPDSTPRSDAPTIPARSFDIPARYFQSSLSTRPSFIRTTRGIRSAKARLCVTTMIVVPRCLLILKNRS